MLSSIKIKNFKSIVDLNVDFSFDRTAPGGYEKSDINHFFDPILKESNTKKNTKDRIVPVTMFFGANGSGKSTIIEAFSSLIKIVSANNIEFCKNVLKNNYNINKLNTLSDNVTFAITLYIGKAKYTYTISYNNEQILQESLLDEKKNKFVYHIIDGELKEINLKGKVLDIKKEFKARAFYKDFDKDSTVQVRTLLNVISSQLSDVDVINELYYFVTKKIVLMTSKEKNYASTRFVNLLAKSDSEEARAKAFSDIAEVIQSIDFDISKLEFSKEELKPDEKGRVSIPPRTEVEADFKNNTFYQPKIASYHRKIDGTDAVFDFNEDESLGTNSVFNAIAAMLKVLRDGGVLIVDELDSSLHTLVLKELIKLFKFKDINTKSSQLICTLHDASLLEDKIYSLSEFSFVNKNVKQGSTITRLSQIKGEKTELNLRKRYMKGTYLGIPYPSISYPYI
ncbi:MAG: ATP-binding protein [Proteobacteria bacterium]|nr:ATP-binding protein [Pseudomonadota bacterium]